MENKSLLIILPAHNEGLLISNVIHEINSILSDTNTKFSFFISEDGSHDNTVDELEVLSKQLKLKYISSKKRKGYAMAVVDGILSAKSDFILFLDSDGQVDPKIIPEAFEEIIKKENTIIIGNRFIRRDPFIRKIYSKLFFYFYKFLFPIKLKDPSCPFVLCATKDASLIAKYWLSFGERVSEGFWWEFNAWAYKLNIKFYEIDVNHRERDGDEKTKVYKLKKMPGIIFRNVIGIIRVYCEKI